MIWVILTALAAVCGAAKLDTKYLPPLSARTAEGSAGALLATLDGSQGLPTGSYTNDAQGVVVDAVNPGTRTSGLEATGLGGPRTSYGSKDSKVGDAAFGVFSLGSGLSRIAPGFGSFVESDERQADKASGNSLKFGSDVGLDNHSGFETDNGISVGANGEAAVGVKAQGSYDAQKYKGDDDYSINGAGINNGQLTISGGDATSSGGQRPTSGILVGSFTPGSVGSLSSQGHSAQGSGEVSGNKQSSFDINKDQSVSQGFTVLGGSSSIGGQIGQVGSKDSNSVSHDQLSSLAGSSQSPESKFGAQTSKSEGSHAHAHATAGSPVRSPSFQNGASAFSSAATKGSGSASAFASSAPFGSGLKNEYLPALSSFGSVNQHTHGSTSGSDASAGESFTGPSTSKASASVSGSQTQEQGPDNSYYYKKPSQPFTIPTVVSSGQYSVHRQPNAPVSSIAQQVSKYPNNPATVVTGQYQGTSSSSYNGITQASISKFSSGSSSSSTKFASQSSQLGSKPSTQLGQTSQSPQFVSKETHSGHQVQGQKQFVQTGLQVPTQSGSTETHFGHQTSQTSGSSQSPSQQNQGTIYQYNKPATTQSTFQQTQVGSNVQTSFGQKPIVTSQVSGSKYQFGSFGSQFNQKPVKTQSSIDSSNRNSQSQTSFVQKPIVSSQTATQSGSQFVQTGLQVPTQSGLTETHFGHQTSQTSGSSQSPSQHSQGTIYQYNKPATTLPAQGNKDTSSFVHASVTSVKPGQVGTDSRFGTQQSSSKFGSQSTFQQTQTGSNVQTSVGQKPVVSSQLSGSKYQFGSFGSQFNQKPVKTQGSIVSSNTNTQSQTSFVQKPIVSPQTTTQSGSQFAQTGLQVPTQSGSTETHFGHQTSQTSDNSQSPSQQNQGTIYQYNKPATTLPAQGNKDTSSFVQASVTSVKPGQVGTDSRFGTQQSSSKFGSQSTFQQTQTGSNVQTSVGKKPIVSSQLSGSKYQFGSFGSQFNQKPVKTQGSIVSSNTNTQSQTSFVQKPIVSPQTTTQSGSQFAQIGLQVPTQSGSTETHFGHQTSQTSDNSQSPSQQNQGTIYQYNKPATTLPAQGNKDTSSFVQASVTSVKPGQVGTNSRFGTQQSSSKFGSQSTFQQTQTGSNVQTSVGQKPIVSSQLSGSKYQFGSFGSQFNQKPVKTQGSIVSSNTNTQSQTSFVQKPIVSPQTTTQSGSQFAQTGLQVPTQSGSTETHFGHQTSQTSDNSQSPSQQNQGTIYQYNKPATTLPAQGNKDTSSFVQASVTSVKPGQVGTDSRFGTQQSSSKFGSQSTFQQTQTGSNVQTSVGQKPIVSSQLSGSKYQFGSFGSQFNQKPVKTQGSIVSSNTNTQSQTSFVQKPIVSPQTTTQSGSQFAQTGLQVPTQSGSTETHFGHQTSQTSDNSQSPSQQNQGTIYQYNKPATTLPAQGNKDTSSFVQASVTSVKPGQVGTDSRFGTQQSSSKFGSQSTFQQTQTGSNVQTSVGQKPVVNSQLSGSKYQFGSFGSQFNQKPVKTQGSIVSSNTNTQSQTSFVQKPIVRPQTTTQSGSQFAQTGLQVPTQSGSTETHFGHQTSQTSGSSQSQSQHSQGTIYQYNKPATTLPAQGNKDTSSFVQASVTSGKPGQVETDSRFGTQQSSNKFGSQSTFQQTQTGSNVQTSVGQKPIVSSQLSGSKYQFGSFGPQFNQKPGKTQGSIVSSNTNTQSSQAPTQQNSGTIQSSFVGTSYLPSKIGSSGSQSGENVQSSLGAGSVSTTAKPASGSSYHQTQIGFKPTTTKDSSFSYTPSQISQFEKKPVVSTTQTQFGSTSKFGQNSQSSLIGTSYLPSKIGSSGSQFGQNTQSALGAKGSGLTSTTSQTSFGIKPVDQQVQFVSSGSQNSQASQFAKKPVTITTTGVTSQQTKFELSGSQISQNTQSTDGVGSVPITTPSRVGESSQTIVPISTISQSVELPQFAQKPIQTAFGSSTTHFGQKPPAHTFASSSGSNVVPFSNTQTGQVSKYENSQFGVQNLGVVSSTQKPVGSSSSQTNYQQYQYTQTIDKSGSQSQFGKGSQSNVGSGQTIFGAQSQKPFGSTQTTYPQTQYFTQGQKPFGSSQGSTFQIVGQAIGEKPTQGTVQTSSVPGYKYPNSQSVFTTQFGSQSSVAQDQKVQQSQTNFNSAVSTSQTPTNGQPLKPFGVPSTQSTFQQSQSTVSSSQSGVQAVKPSYFTTPFIQTSFNKFGGKPFQPASTVSTQGSNVKTQSSVVSTPQFGVQNQGVVSSTQKPVGSSSSQTNYQQYQYTQTVDKSGSQSQFGKGSQSNVGSGQTTFGAQSQKPFGSTQTTYPQTQYFTQGQKPFDSSQGSTFQIVGQAIGEKPTQGTGQTSSVSGYKYSKPQSVFNTQFGSQSSGAQDQKVQQSQTNFNSAVSTSQTPINGQPLKPFGVPSTQSTFQQSQSTVSSSQFGVQAVKPTGFTAPVIQTSFNKFSGKPFQPASTVSTQGSNVKTQSSVVSTPQFGVQNQGVVSSTQKPVGSFSSQTNYQKYQYTQTVDKSGSQSQFGKGSQSNVGSGQTTFGAQSQKPFGSTQTTYPQTQYFTQGQKPFGSSQGSTFQIVGQAIREKPTQGTVQTSSVSGYKYSKPQSVFNTQFGSQSSGAQDQKVQQSQTNFNSAVSTSQTPINGQPLKPFGVPSTQSTFQQSQSTVSSSQFGVQAVKPTGFTAPVIQTSFNKFSGKPFQPASTVSTQGSNVKTQSSVVSTPQFGVQNQDVVLSTQKPVGSSSSQTNYQKYQYTQTVDKSGSQSQFFKGPESNVRVGSGQIGQTLFGVQAQKPFVSTQTNYKQTQITQGQKPFGSSQGSILQIGGPSVGQQPTQGTGQTSSVSGYKYSKPQSVFNTQFGGQSNSAQDQKVQQSQTNFNSAVSTSQTPINGLPLKPFGVPSTQSTFQQSQSTVSSSQFGVQAVKPTGFTAPVIQTSYNKNSGKPFQPASIVSTQGSNVQSQSSAVSSSQFGVPTPSTEIAHFSGRPEFSILPSHGVALNPSVSSNTQAPSRVGSNEGLAVSTVQTPIESVPGYELVIKEENSANHEASHAFVGLGEQFGGPRDPPRFEEETGYYY